MLQKNALEKTSSYFDFERWDVYRAALEFIVVIKNVVESLPRGNAYLSDQLQRAGTSIPLNIAEGAGEHSGLEKARFYRMAKRSATECASILDVYREGFKNWELPRRRLDFGSGAAGAEAAQPEGLGDAGGSQKQWLSDAARTNFSITSGIYLRQ